MPPHSLHLLQPLNVGCFSPLKQAYGRQIDSLIRSYINHVTKLEFLPAFKAAFEQAIRKDTILGGFRGAGLVPYNPEAVTLKLDIKLRTLTPPIEPTALWEPKTPSNARELASQSTCLRDKIQRHQGSSPTSILESLDQLTRGVELIMHSTVLLRDQVSTLQQANEAATKRKARKKKRI